MRLELFVNMIASEINYLIAFIKSRRTQIVFFIAICYSAVSILADTNLPGSLQAGPMALTKDSNIYAELYLNVFHNPASLMVFGVLLAVAFLYDDLPWFNSRYVTHFTVIVGAGIYHKFAYVSSVPSNFPDPQAFFAANGFMVGFVAALTHRQAVARMLNFWRTRNGEPNNMLDKSSGGDDKR